MNKKLYKIILLIILGITGILINAPVKAQTPGTLTFSITTTEPSGGYNGVHVIAIWIEDTNGGFVKTKIRYAQDRIQYLDHWIASSAYNVVDATTGATLPAHGNLIFNWNGTDVSGNLVADKPYRVWIQMSDRNESGPTTFVLFNKDTSTQHITPADTGNFTNMDLVWNPTIGIGETEMQNLAFRCEPNPFSNHTSITYCLARDADVTLTLLDATGKTIAVLLDQNQPAGKHSLCISSTNLQLESGIYYLKINTGFGMASQKIVFTR